MSAGEKQTIKVAAAILTSAAGELLLVRKRNTTAFMQPGGKIEPSEEPETCLVRELQEELGINVAKSQLRPLGNYSAPAANEPGSTVDASLFALRCDQEIKIGAEIEEALWIAPGARFDKPLAPLSRDIVLPLVQEGGRGN